MDIRRGDYVQLKPVRVREIGSKPMSFTKENVRAFWTAFGTPPTYIKLTEDDVEKVIPRPVITIAVGNTVQHRIHNQWYGIVMAIIEGEENIAFVDWQPDPASGRLEARVKISDLKREGE